MPAVNGNGHAGSVTRFDIPPDGKQSSGPMVAFPYLLGGLPSSSILPPLQLEYSWAFDYVLRQTPRHEPMWSAALRKAISKIAARSWQVKDSNDSTRRTTSAQNLLLAFGGPRLGWVKAISMNARDFLTVRNGAWLEAVWAKGKITGIYHLDSLHCRRTGDPTWPMVYRDLMGDEHALRDYQCFDLVDMPDSDVSHFGLGLPAAESAYDVIRYRAGIGLYNREKIFGNGATALHFVSGVLDPTLESIINTNEAIQHGKGLILYKGAIIAGVMGDQPPGIASINLKEAPDGFDAEQVDRYAATVYGNALGIPVQDVIPLSGQGLGTGTQTRVLEEAAEGQGLASYVKQLEHIISHSLLATTTTFYMSNNDVREQKAKAEVSNLRTEGYVKMIDAGMITAQQAQQLAVDNDDLPREMMTAPDATPGGTLSDNEKPLDGAEQPAPQPAAMTTKAGPTLDDVQTTLAALIADITQQLQDGLISVPAWRDLMDEALTDAAGQAYTIALPLAEKAFKIKVPNFVQDAVASTRTYLDKFADTIEAKLTEGLEWDVTWNSRAKMYAQSPKVIYWKTKTGGLNLPGYPGDGKTICLTNCHCAWEIIHKDTTVHATWKLGAGDNCKNCKSRAAAWSPFIITREG